MSRRPYIDPDDRRDVVELRGDVERPAHTGPADGCDGSPWCTCWDCDRVPNGGPFAFETDVPDYGLEDPF